MKQAAAVAHFRQLCCLGIDSQTAMPSLLRALHGLIGSETNSFYWAAHNGDLCNVYFEQPMPPAIAALFFSEFLNNRGRDFSAVQIRKYLRNGAVVGNSARLFEKTFHRSDLYNLIWRPLRRQQLLWARVRDAQGRANGIALTRVEGDALFSERDEQLLAQLVPYLAHAVSAQPSAPAQLVEGGESGVIVLNESGQVQHQSAEGRRLLLLAGHPRIAPSTVDWRDDSVLPLALAELRDRLEALASGRPASPPVFELQNAWGKFVLRAYFMESGERTGSRLTVVLIERHVPLKLKLMHAMQSLPLSAKQKEVCLLLTEGAGYRAMAERLCVRPNTVIDHVRKIYDRLDVRSHRELLSRLIHGEQPPSIEAERREPPRRGVQ